MSTLRKVARNMLLNFSGSLAERIIGFLVSLILIRYLGSGNFGKYSLVYAFLSFFSFFIAMGIDCVIFRELSRDFNRGAELINSAITLKFFFALTGVILSWIILQWMHYEADIRLLIYIASLGMLFSFGTLFNNVFMAKLYMGYVAVITIVIKFILAILTITLIFLKAKLFYFVLINMIIYVIQVSVAYYFSRGLVSVKLKINLRDWGQLLRYSWPLLINAVFISVYSRVDQLLLFHFKGQEALGYYAASVKLLEPPLLVIGAFLNSIFPLLSRFAVSSPDSFKKTYEASFKYLMIFFGAIAMTLTLFSTQIIIVCFGRHFLPSYISLIILSWSTLFISAGVVHTFLLLAKDLQHLDILFTFCMAVINFLLNLVLIPRYGLVGAAISSVISYSCLIPLSYSLKRTRAFAKAIIQSLIKPLFAGLASGYAVYSFSFLHPVFNLAFGILIYLFILFIIKGINAQDLRYAREILTARSFSSTMPYEL